MAFSVCIMYILKSSQDLHSGSKLCNKYNIISSYLKIMTRIINILIYFVNN